VTDQWTTTRIGNLAAVFDGPHATPMKTEVGPWFLSISSLKEGRLDLTESAHLSEADFVKWTRRVTPQSGDLLFSYETRLGSAALMPSGVKACLGRRMGLLRPNREQVDERFLLYAYLGPGFQQEIAARAVRGATVDRIPIAEIADWPLRVPPLREQRAIAEVLGALDDKIAVNERIATTSLELGGALLTRAAQQESLDTTVGDIAELVYGKSLPEPNRCPGDVPVFGCTGQVGWHDTPLTPSRGPVVGRKGANVGHVSWMSAPGWVIDTAFYARPLATNISVEALYFVLNSAGLKSLIGDSAVPGVNRDLAHRRRIRIPVTHLMSDFCIRARGLLDTAVHAEAENRTLADLREILLPQLVTGEIRVKDALRVVEDIAS
jgi:type I restriction enzyme S subunit